MENQQLWDKIDELELDLEQAKRSLLQGNGWRNTSRTPGSYWMWTKELAIGTVYVDEKVALRIQSDLDSGYYNDMEKPKEQQCLLNYSLFKASGKLSRWPTSNAVHFRSMNWTGTLQKKSLTVVRFGLHG